MAFTFTTFTPKTNKAESERSDEFEHDYIFYSCTHDRYSHSYIGKCT